MLPLRKAVGNGFIPGQKGKGEVRVEVLDAAGRALKGWEPSTGGWVLIGFDGSRASAARTKSNEAAF